jgi:type III pantothenate kinase
VAGRAGRSRNETSLLYHLRRLCRERFGVESFVARASLDRKFDIKVDNPSEVGADRLLNTLADV